MHPRISDKIPNDRVLGIRRPVKYDSTARRAVHAPRAVCAAKLEMIALLPVDEPVNSTRPGSRSQTLRKIVNRRTSRRGRVVEKEPASTLPAGPATFIDNNAFAAVDPSRNLVVPPGPSPFPSKGSSSPLIISELLAVDVSKNITVPGAAIDEPAPSLCT